MSSPRWYAHMVQTFPEWNVHDASGNNFYMMRDFQTRSGETVVVGVGECVAYVIRHKSGFGYIKYGEWDLQCDVDDTAGQERLYDRNDLCVPLFVTGDNSPEVEEVGETARQLFDEETLESIRNTVVIFLERYWEGQKI